MWPRVFEEFCIREGIDLSIYEQDPPYRYVTGVDDILGEVVPWLPSFRRIPAHTNISQIPEYKDGKLLSMDVSSGLAVHLLDIQTGHEVLDLCCAPGMKMVLMSKLGAHVTGVDVSPHRLADARAMCKKYKVPYGRLFLADGTNVSLPVHELLPRSSGISPPVYECFWSSSVYRKSPGTLTPCLYDRVIVDAQCTHDGSVKHVRKLAFDSAEWSQFEPEALEDLYRLQLNLLLNGWRHLKPGGVLIYSTCSLSHKQNEGIVEQFLSIHPEAVSHPFLVDGLVDNQHMLRLQPDIHLTTGFFIARFRK